MREYMQTVTKRFKLSKAVQQEAYQIKSPSLLQSKLAIKCIIAICLILNSILISKIIAGNTILANAYAAYIYPIVVNTISRICSIFPFSVSEIALYLIVLLSVICFIRLCYLFIKRREAAKEKLALYMSNILLFSSVLYFMFVIGCGINYHRAAFSTVSDLSVGKYSVDELSKVCTYLTKELQYWYDQIERDEAGNSVLQADVAKEARAAMKNLSMSYPVLSGYYPNAKPVLNSQILSYQHLSGVYSPFTVEANYNKDMIDYNIPFTVCHELSHLKGFMREDEANYIAYLACASSENADFQYSGAMLAWIYCTNALNKEDKEMYGELYGNLPDEVKTDLAQNSAFWKSYEGKTAEIADKVNDTYLKVNKQKEGVKSYGRMVDLVVAQYLDDISLAEAD